MVRLVRASALTELSKDYVTARQGGGRTARSRLMLVTVLPNCMAPLIVQAALGVSDAILAAAGLGFLGLGAQPPMPEWGSMLADSTRPDGLPSLGHGAPGHCHPDHGSCHQPHGRRLARRARSAPQAELTR